MGENEIREHLSNDANLEAFGAYVDRIGPVWTNTNADPEYQAFRNARNQSGGGQDYAFGQAGTWLTNPFKFPNAGEAYRPSPLAGSVEAEIRHLDETDVGLKSGRPLSSLSQRELREEFEVSNRVRKAMAEADLQGDEAQDALGSQFADVSAGFASNFFTNDEAAAHHLENIHKMRHLRDKTGWRVIPGVTGEGGATGGTAPTDSGIPPDLAPTQNEDAPARPPTLGEYAQMAAAMAAEAERAGDTNTAQKYRDFVAGIQMIPASPNPAEEENALINHVTAFQASDRDLFLRMMGRIHNQGVAARQ
jgi:hypothetical protein